MDSGHEALHDGAAAVIEERDAILGRDAAGLATSQEVADFCGLAEGSLRRFRVEGRGPTYIKVGGRVRYRWDDVRRWLASHERAAEHEAAAPRRQRRRASAR
jgi:hypothetical protein